MIDNLDYFTVQQDEYQKVAQVLEDMDFDSLKKESDVVVNQLFLKFAPILETFPPEALDYILARFDILARARIQK